MKKSILLGLILSLLIVLPVFAQDPIKIGVYAPLSGDSAMVGQTLVEGVQLATKQKPKFRISPQLLPIQPLPMSVTRGSPGFKPPTSFKPVQLLAMRSKI